MHFIANVGTDYEIDVEALIKSGSGKTRFENNMMMAKEYAESVLKDGDFMFFNSRPNPGALEPYLLSHSLTDENATYDWRGALGTSSCQLVFEVSRNGNNYHMFYRYIAYDYYDWEKDKEEYFIPGLKDGDMWKLHNIGWARNYFLSGEKIDNMEWSKL